MASSREAYEDSTENDYRVAAWADEDEGGRALAAVPVRHGGLFPIPSPHNHVGPTNRSGAILHWKCWDTIGTASAH